MRRTGIVLLFGAALVAAATYGFTLPDGIPWGVAGSNPYAWIFASLAAGFIAMAVNWHLGWRFAASAALLWIFFPRIWNGAILGTRAVSILSLVAILGWFLDVVFLVSLYEFSEAKKKTDLTGRNGIIGAHLAWVIALQKRWTGRGMLVAAAVFALVSIAFHDYRLGSAATAFARDVVSAANGRVIVLNGFCDEQVKGEVRSAKDEGRSGVREWSDDDFRYICPDANDREYRESVVDWARREWPAETNLAVAAQVGVRTFLDAAIAAHPERFYIMNGGSETYAEWEARWRRFAPYLKSSDRFVRIARRSFAYNAIVIANGARDGEADSAWRLYWRVLDEVEPTNISALVNLNEMVRRGYAATDEERQLIKDGIAEFFSNKVNRRNLREIVRAAGPVKSDPGLLARLHEEYRQRVAKILAAGGKVEIAPEVAQLVDNGNRMIAAMDDGDVGKAGRYARQILDDPQWRGFIPANMTMGAVTAKSGDYVAAEAFYRAATAGTNGTPAAVWNDYADTLMHLGKLDEAERIARRAVADTDEKFYVARLTLAEILSVRVREEKLDNVRRVALQSEIDGLVSSALSNTPPASVYKVRHALKSCEPQGR